MSEKLLELKFKYNQKSFLYHIVNDIVADIICTFIAAIAKAVGLTILMAFCYLLIIFILIDITVRTCRYIVKEDD